MQNFYLIKPSGPFNQYRKNMKQISQIMFSFVSSQLKELKNVESWVLKADFQSVLRTLESLFTTFVLFHVRRHKM